MNQFVELLVGGLSSAAIYALDRARLRDRLQGHARRSTSRRARCCCSARTSSPARTSARLLAGGGRCGVLAAAVAAVLIDVVLHPPHPARRPRHAGDPHDRRRHPARHRAHAPDRHRRAATSARRGARTSTESSASAIATSRVIAAAVARRCSSAASGAAFKCTDWGIAMRSAAEDGEAAALMGIRLNRVAAARVGARGRAGRGRRRCSSRPSRPPGVDRRRRPARAGAIPAAVLGGLDSTAGAVVGGLIIGVVADAHRRLPGRARRSSAAGSARSRRTSVMLLVLLWRPSGLFGTRELTRV